MEKRRGVSISQLLMMSKCGEMYRLRYIEGQKRPPGVAAIIGSGVDHSVNVNLTHKIENDGKLLDRSDVEDAASTGFDQKWKEGVILTDDEKVGGVKKTKGKAKDDTVRLATLHHDERAPIIEPVSADHIQRWWRVEIDGYDKDLVGVIDVEEEKTIRDTKTSGKKHSQDAADRSLQLTAYALAVHVLDGLKKKVALDFLIRKKSPESITLESERSNEDFRALLARFEMMLIALEKGVFLPAQPDDWWCSPKWCGFYPCQYVTGGDLVQIQGVSEKE